MLGGGDRSHCAVASAAATVESRAHTGEHLEHVAHQIISGLTGIGHYDPPALLRQRRLQVFQPETLIRITSFPFHLLPPSQQVPSA